MRLKQVWKSSWYSTETELISTEVVLSTLLYGCSCWRLVKQDLQLTNYPVFTQLPASTTDKPGRHEDNPEDEHSPLQKCERIGASFLN